MSLLRSLLLHRSEIMAARELCAQHGQTSMPLIIHTRIERRSLMLLLLMHQMRVLLLLLLLQMRWSLHQDVIVWPIVPYHRSTRPSMRIIVHACTWRELLLLTSTSLCFQERELLHLPRFVLTIARCSRGWRHRIGRWAREGCMSTSRVCICKVLLEVAEVGWIAQSGCGWCRARRLATVQIEAIQPLRCCLVGVRV